MIMTMIMIMISGMAARGHATSAGAARRGGSAVVVLCATHPLLAFPLPGPLS